MKFRSPDYHVVNSILLVHKCSDLMGLLNPLVFSRSSKTSRQFGVTVIGTWCRCSGSHLWSAYIMSCLEFRHHECTYHEPVPFSILTSPPIISHCRFIVQKHTCRCVQNTVCDRRTDNSAVANNKNLAPPPRIYPVLRPPQQNPLGSRVRFWTPK